VKVDRRTTPGGAQEELHGSRVALIDQLRHGAASGQTSGCTVAPIHCLPNRVHACTVQIIKRSDRAHNKTHSRNKVKQVPAVLLDKEKDTYLALKKLWEGIESFH
jgi:hypothetical protein